nr:immunoglobulin light chain junction region [Macaca mulatta]MOV96363.1 immunoglobulin light chain junction region [Macaca mulatta]
DYYCQSYDISLSVQVF